jgi:hypothetical protein
MISSTKSTLVAAGFAFVGSVLSTFGTIYLFVERAHAAGGHERHDKQIEAVEGRAQASQNHLATQVDARFRVMEASSARIEMKQDAMVRAAGGVFPRAAPPFEEVPLHLRPGGVDRGPLYYWPKPDGGPGVTSTTPP